MLQRKEGRKEDRKTGKNEGIHKRSKQLNELLTKQCGPENTRGK